jgi:hypothetical protein
MSGRDWDWRPPSLPCPDEEFGYPAWAPSFNGVTSTTWALFDSGVAIDLQAVSFERSPLLMPSPKNDGYYRLNDAGIAAYMAAVAAKGEA